MLHWSLWALMPFLYAETDVSGHQNHWLVPARGRDCICPSLIEATVDDLRDGLSKGCFSSVDLVNAYMTRIHEVNSTLHVVLEANPDALDIARQLDLERKIGLVRGPLHGLPIFVKANIGTKDKMGTTAGSYALVGAQTDEDSTVAKKLRDNGLVILGKTSMSEWANFRSLNSSNGWNAQGGQTYGAYYPEQDPSGSSSGSGVGTDLGLALAALGTETNGSILSPSEKSNIVGIKPSVGLTSRHLVIPVSERQDTIGPMARTVKDAAMILQAIAGPDKKDNYTLASPFGYNVPNYAAACKFSGLEGKRIGIPRNVINTLDASYAPVVSAFNAGLSVISAAGATIVEDADFTAYDEYLKTMIPASMVAADFVSNIVSYLSMLKTNLNGLQNLEDIRRYIQKDPLEDYPSRDTGLWDMTLAANINNTSPEFWPMYLQTLFFGEEGGLMGALSRNNLDAVVLPTVLASGIPAILGTPAITVPLGSFPNGTAIQHNERGNLVEQAPGIPFGISFLGPKWSEEALIGMAYAFEQRTLIRKKLQRYIEPRSELRSLL
ncbi:putative amidase [Aspergillus clavatus NRRL 1]|uniref:Amidase, putative n=1 Tax=Aspergillus clavatus (strain ATCC 1007 / CBS 513.65 / DSM 816 / NCTC 3887 / NRRL 1 / QM 1276 / 107) TaxID=344612 RepID=A1CAZ8_ASPCL|nr:amidase, putative [Aspergillus clavatus NRRL 1]EAW12916.1 amidase, putative [Aspergillus clavatus NRRL 1]